jgi:hypothetical protein
MAILADCGVQGSALTLLSSGRPQMRPGWRGYRARTIAMAVESIRVENRSDGDRKAGQHFRRRRFPAAVAACFFISIAAQTKNGDGFGLRVDDPVFRDAALGIVGPASQPDLVPVALHSRLPERGQRPARSGFAGADRRPKAGEEDRAHGTCPAEFAAVTARNGPFRLEALRS